MTLKDRLIRMVPDANGDFRSSHSARRLGNEAARFNLDEYRRRHGESAFAGSLNKPQEGGGSGFDPYAALGVRAEFGKPTDEDTRTWGNSTVLIFQTLAFGHFTPVSTPQLIHVARRRPTSFNVLTVITLGNVGPDGAAAGGWTGEGPWTLNANFFVGVGQASVAFSISIPIPTPTDGQQIVSTDQFPLNAIQSNCTLFPNSGSPTLTAKKNVTIAQLAAPVFE